MEHAHLISFFFIFASSIIHDTNGTPSNERNVIIDIVTKQIENLIDLVESLVNKALEELFAMTKAAAEITSTAIKATVNSINLIIDFAMDSVRTIAQEAIDNAINVTECYVVSVDNLNIIRRRLIEEEILCATDHLIEFDTIINDTIQNFNDNLVMVAELPKRLIGCMTTIHMIKCLTQLGTDVTQLTIDIPQQIMDTMENIMEKISSFVKDVHQCQFQELREAVEDSRKVVNGMRYCVREANQTQPNMNY